jgi:hypothetical protein
MNKLRSIHCVFLRDIYKVVIDLNLNRKKISFLNNKNGTTILAYFLLKDAELNLI